jgi:hypothetical protein
MYSVRYGWGNVKEVSKPNVRLSLDLIKDKDFDPNDLMTKEEAIEAGYKDPKDRNRGKDSIHREYECGVRACQKILEEASQDDRNVTLSDRMDDLI